MNNLWCTNYSSVRTNTRFTVTSFPYINGCKAPMYACINDAKTSSKLPLLPDPGMSLQHFHDCNVLAYKWLAFTLEVIN